jgi:hypothetical protein
MKFVTRTKLKYLADEANKIELKWMRKFVHFYSIPWHSLNICIILCKSVNSQYFLSNMVY